MLNVLNSIKKIAVISLLIGAQNALAWNVQQDDLVTWLNQLSPKPSVYQEMQKFFIKQGNSSAASQQYTTAFIQQIHKELSTSAFQVYQNSLNPNLKCKNRSDVDFPEKMTANKLGAEFESEALRIETMDCLGKLDHHKVFQTFLSDGFQLNSVTGLKKIKSNQSVNQICQVTDVFPVGKSSYCFTQNIWADESTYVIQSFNENNEAGVEAPVYFREVFTIIKKMHNGEVFIYNLAVGRGPDLPLHFVVKSTVKSEQAKAIEALREASSN
ncbi:hypothetical protein [Pseudobdellovibrio sp. HCB154]|uniref:hypothetical protein n=1 Tax=Pseudobdellovibrio sp. HCB154 TaxID=3386277 RepID=UPI00391742CD